MMAGSAWWGAASEMQSCTTSMLLPTPVLASLRWVAARLTAHFQPADAEGATCL